MQLENLVCAQVYAKQLCELGVKFELGVGCEFAFLWVNGDVVSNGFIRHYTDGLVYERPSEDYYITKNDVITIYPAPTAAELMELLPNLAYGFRVSEKNWISQTSECDRNFRGENLADCVAKLLIHLLENNLITLGDKE